MFDVTMSGYAICRPPLALMTNGASEFLERVLRVIRMISQRLLIASVARVLNSQVTCDTAIHPLQTRQDNLLNFNRLGAGQFLLLRCAGAADLLSDVLLLPAFPFSVLVLVVSRQHQSPDGESQQRKPRIKFS